MRYAIVTDTYPPEVNGVALTVHALESGLRALGHAVTVVRPRQDARPPRMHETLVAGARLPRYPGLRFGLPAPGTLLRAWREARPDAVYVATEGPLGWAAIRAARRLGIPAATGFHTRFDTYLRDYGAGFLQGTALAWMRRFHNAGAATLVPTRELEAQLRVLGFHHPLRLPRAVDCAQFDPAHRDEALRASWGASAAAPVVVHVGRLAAEKNLGLLLRAFRALQARMPDTRLVLVGDGPARAALAHAHPDVVFAGIRRGPDLARHFASADLFLFPSRSETFGNVTLEAMASGVATVAFDYGAAREHLRDGRDGIACALDDDDGFVAAAVRLGEAPGLRSALAASGRARVARLRPAQVALDFEAILHGLAIGGGSARDARAA